MSIKKEMKKKYQQRVEAESVPDTLSFPFGRFRAISVPVQPDSSWQSLVFHLAICAFLALSLAANTRTSQALQKIDPGNQKMATIGRKIKTALDQIHVYFGQKEARDDKGVNP